MMPSTNGTGSVVMAVVISHMLVDMEPKCQSLQDLRQRVHVLQRIRVPGRQLGQRRKLNHPRALPALATELPPALHRTVCPRLPAAGVLVVGSARRLRPLAV